MYARITIQSGISAGTSHLIEGRVVRVGSDPLSDICLPTSDIPGHALTLEFHDETCRVYNRSRNSIFVGAQILQPDDVIQWPETDILQIGNDTELLLDTDFHPAHSEFDEQEQETDFDDMSPAQEGFDRVEDDPATTKSNNTKTLAQLIVTIGCVVGCIALLVRDQNRKQSPGPEPRFTEIVSSAINHAEISPQLIQRIQYAEAQRIRGRMDVAQREFQSIRDDLVASKIRRSNTDDETYSNILQFIKTRVN